MQRLLAIVGIVSILFAGCAHERVYRCDDGSGFQISGRGCPDNGCCHICGKPAGCCLGHPLHALKSAWHCKGCDDCYWDEWWSDPPDECDPCDNCGNFVGPRCCPPKRFDALKAHLGGGRYADSACTDGSCADGYCGDDCGGSYAGDDLPYGEQPVWHGGDSLMDNESQAVPQALPAPAAKTKARPRANKMPVEESSEKLPMSQDERLPLPRANQAAEPEATTPDGDSFQPMSPAQDSPPPRTTKPLDAEAKRRTGVPAKTISQRRAAYFEDFSAESQPVHTNKFRMGQR